MPPLSDSDDPHVYHERYARRRDWIWEGFGSLTVFVLSLMLLGVGWRWLCPGLESPWYLLLIAAMLAVLDTITSVRRHRRRRWRELHQLRKERLARGVCPRCEYALTGNLSGICPECGLSLATPPSDED